MIKQKFFNFIRSYLPVSFQNKLYFVHRFRSRIRYQIRRSKGKVTNVSKSNLCQALKKLGLGEGDIVMVYSSLSQLGYVVGGPDTVIDAFLEVIGPNGTLAMPTFTVIGGGLDYLSTNPLFDPKTTASTVGKLTNVFRQRSGVKRSIHPTHSIAAIGHNADWLIKDHELATTPFSNNTPFVKLLHTNAWMVCLGIDIHVLTLYHTFEDLAEDFPFDPYMPNPFQARVLDNKCQEKIVATRIHNPDKARYRIDNHEGVRSVVREFYKNKGILREQEVGDGLIYAIRSEELWRTLQEMLERGITIYADH